ncbi:MAG: proteasome assembly chaperone family protein [Candidatus Aenigmatarchaeota archaeon]|nr:MAG: proteasome assembly chaperone family protein [Candidatus Aenigmarchaeota archaeon]
MDTEIIYLEEPELKNPILIEGLPGVGNVGRIAVSYLAEKLEAKKFAEIYSDSFFPLAVVSPKNEILPLCIDLYYYKGKKDLIFIIGNSQPSDYKGYYALCEKILEVGNKFKVKEIITTGGFGIGVEKQKPRVLGALTDLSDLKKLKKVGVYFEKENPIGSIFGVSGLLLAMAKIKKIKGYSLLGETIGFPILTDPKAAEEVLKVLMKLTDVDIDLRDMDKSVKQLECFLKNLEEKTKQLSQQLHKPTKIYSEYIG